MFSLYATGLKMFYQPANLGGLAGAIATCNVNEMRYSIPSKIINEFFRVA
jgi:hypothetical protein